MKVVIFHYNVVKCNQDLGLSKGYKLLILMVKNALIFFGGFYACLSLFQVVYIFVQVLKVERIFYPKKISNRPDRYAMLGIFLTGMYVLCFGGFFDELAAFFKY